MSTRNIERELIAQNCPAELAKRFSSRYGRSGPPTGDAEPTPYRTIKADVRSADPKGEDFVVEGLAAKYNQLSSLIPPGFRENIQKGAFRSAFKPDADVRMLFNHNTSAVLGRTRSKTLQLIDADDGLRYRCQLDPNNSDHRNLYSLIKRGDIDSMSFGFSLSPAPGSDSWEEMTDERGQKVPLRTLKSVELAEISITPWAAYPATTAEARSLFPLMSPDGSPLDIHPSWDRDLADQIAAAFTDFDNRLRWLEQGIAIRTSEGR